MSDVSSLINELQHGDAKALARTITLVENESDRNELLQKITIRDIPLIGITGPPGAGKSSLVNSLVTFLIRENKKIGVVAVDPTSPFNYGSLLGDRIRLADHFNHPDVFIRSLATRGSLGGLTDKIMEVTDVMKAAPFDYLFVETVGVGQSEVEIAGLADTTVVVLNPESGDEIQTMKAGLMEIADIFVVNKSDHAGADSFTKNLRALVSSKLNKEWQIPVIKTVAIRHEGTEELLQQIHKHQDLKVKNDHRIHLLAEKAWKIIQKEKMKSVSREKLLQEVKMAAESGSLNIYHLAEKFR